MSVNDTLDAILLGAFFFGLLFSVASLFLGVADLGFGHHGDAGHDGPGFLNVGVILAFITWFGGISYLLRDGVGLIAPISILLGLAAGIFGGFLVHRFLRLVRGKETVLNPDDYRMPGVIGKISSSIREDGTGEIVYVQQGIRHVSAARSASGTAIPRGAEVVILREEKGVVYVDLWETLVADGDIGKIETPLKQRELTS